VTFPEPGCDLSAILEKLAAIQATQAAQGRVLDALTKKLPPAYVGRLGMTIRLTPE
jgi:hypothetical protein